MDGKYHRLNSDLIKNALESDSEVTLGNSNLILSSNISSERDFEQAIDDVEKHIEKEETNDIVFTYTKESEDLYESRIPLESTTGLNESLATSIDARDAEIQIDKSILTNVDQLFPEQDSFRHCNYLVKSIQSLVRLEHKIDSTDYGNYDFHHTSQSVSFVEKSYDIQLPNETTSIATYSSKLYLGTSTGEIIRAPLDSFTSPQNFTEKLYIPTTTSSSISCMCISRDSKWALTGHQNGIVQLLQFVIVDKQEQSLIQGLNFMRSSNDSQRKKPGSEYLNSIASVSIPKIPLNIECLNKTNWDLFISICKGFNTPEYSLFIFSISTTVLSYKLAIVDSLPFHTLSLTYHPGMISTEIDLEITASNEGKKTNSEGEKRQKNTFNFSIFQPGLVHMMSYTKNKTITLVSTINIDRNNQSPSNGLDGENNQNTSNFDGESRGVWLRSAATFQSLLFVIDLHCIHLISPSGGIISYNIVGDFSIPYEIVSLRRLSLSIVVALDIKCSLHFFQVLGHGNSLSVVKIGEINESITEVTEIRNNSSIPRMCCSIGEVNVEEKGCKKFVATVNSIANLPNINRKTVPIDSFLCKFGQISLFYAGKLHLFIISSWYNLLCKLAFNKKFSKLLRLISGLYQNRLPRLLEFQSNRYQSDAQKLLLYTLHQSCAQAVKMKHELGACELFLSDKRLESLKSLCNILIESCISTNMYNELVGLLFRSFNGIYLTNLFISQFLDIIVKRFTNIESSNDKSTPYPLGLPLSEAIVTLIRNSLNEINIGEILEPQFFTGNLFLSQNPTDAMIRYHLVLKILHNISNLALNDKGFPMVLESEPFQNLAIEFELWDILVKLKMDGLTSDSLVYLFDTLALQLVKTRESTFEKHFSNTFNKLKKVLLPLIPPPNLYNNNCLTNTFTSLWSIADSTTGYFSNPNYKNIFTNTLKQILIMSFGSENVNNTIKYTENALLHPVLTESILLNPTSWFDYSIKIDTYHPVLKAHYRSYDLDIDKITDPEVVAYKIIYFENGFKLYALSFMIYHVLHNQSFDLWDEVLEIFQSPIMLYNDDMRLNVEKLNLAKPHNFGNCKFHQMDEFLESSEYEAENVLFSARNDSNFGEFFINQNFDIRCSCRCYYGYLNSLLGHMVKRQIPFSSPPQQLYTISKLPLKLSIEDRCTIYEALSQFDEIFQLLDREGLSRFLLHHFDFIEIDENDELEITSPRVVNCLLTRSVIKNINILKELGVQIVRRVLFYTLSNESVKQMMSTGVLSSVPEMADILLDSLHDYPELQAEVYILLMKNLKDKLGKFDRFDHLLELLCKTRCKRLISLLKKEPKIDINKCLAVATDKYPFPEARSYLLERAGNIHAALEGVDDFDEMTEITIRAIGKIRDHSLLSRWINMLDSPKDVNYILSKVTRSLIKLLGHGLDISEHPDLIGRYIKHLEKHQDNLSLDVNDCVIEFFRKILRSLDMKRGVFIESLQLAKQSLDIEVAKKMKSLSRGILIGKTNSFDNPNQLPFSNVCGGCNRTLQIDDEMRIFLCGHVFHLQCKPEIACNLH